MQWSWKVDIDNKDPKTSNLIHLFTDFWADKNTLRFLWTRIRLYQTDYQPAKHDEKIQDSVFSEEILTGEYKDATEEEINSQVESLADEILYLNKPLTQQRQIGRSCARKWFINWCSTKPGTLWNFHTIQRSSSIAL